MVSAVEMLRQNRVESFMHVAQKTLHNPHKKDSTQAIDFLFLSGTKEKAPLRRIFHYGSNRAAPKRPCSPGGEQLF